MTAARALEAVVAAIDDDGTAPARPAAWRLPKTAARLRERRRSSPGL